MKSNKDFGKKERGYLKKDIADTANTSKEFVQDKFHDAKKGTKKALKTVGKHIKGAAKELKKV